MLKTWTYDASIPSFLYNPKSTNNWNHFTKRMVCKRIDSLNKRYINQLPFSAVTLFRSGLRGLFKMFPRTSVCARMWAVHVSLISTIVMSNQRQYFNKKIEIKWHQCLLLWKFHWCIQQLLSPGSLLLQWWTHRIAP